MLGGVYSEVVGNSPCDPTAGKAEWFFQSAETVLRKTPARSGSRANTVGPTYTPIAKV